MAIFEIAHIYLPRDGAVPEEPRRLSITLAGPRELRSWLSSAEATSADGVMDFYDLKGIIETLCDRLGIADAVYAPMEHPTYRPGRVAALTVDGRPAGVLGEVHPVVAEGFELAGRVCLAELDLEVLLAAARPVRPYCEVRTPTNEDRRGGRRGVPSDAVEATIRRAGERSSSTPCSLNVTGGQIGEGRRARAHSPTVPVDRTTGDEAARHGAIIRTLG